MQTSFSSLLASAFGLAFLFAPTASQAQHDGDPPAIQHEHAAIFALVPHDDATHVAAISGSWSNPLTWGGEVPTELSKVLIPEGVEVELDFINTTTHQTLRIDGTLKFATAVNTGLMVDTIVVGMNGHLQMGTASDPVQPGVEAKIIIADTGDIDIAWDPNELSRGLISHGRVTMHGTPKTGNLDLAVPAQRNQKQLTLESAPLNWEIGDVLILPGTHSRRDFDETLIITGIKGPRWTLPPWRTTAAWMPRGVGFPIGMACRTDCCRL